MSTSAKENSVRLVITTLTNIMKSPVADNHDKIEAAMLLLNLHNDPSFYYPND